MMDISSPYDVHSGTLPATDSVYRRDHRMPRQTAEAEGQRLGTANKSSCSGQRGGETDTLSKEGCEVKNGFDDCQVIPRMLQKLTFSFLKKNCYKNKERFLANPIQQAEGKLR